MRYNIQESKRDNALDVFLPLFEKRGIKVSISQLKQFLLNKFVTEAGIHNLSLGSNYYLVGVARYYFNGDLTSNVRLNALYSNVTDRFKSDVCHKLDILVNELRNRYIDSVGVKFELPEDFGNLSIDVLFRKYNKVLVKALGGADKNTEVEEKGGVVDNRSGKHYTYEILYSYDDAKKYNSYTEPGAWCITYGKQHYDSYRRRLGIHYVIFKRNGFESVVRQKGKNWSSEKPQDEYGNSLIALLQSNETGEPVYITSRWNHGSANDGSMCEADHAYTKEEFFRVTGCNDGLLQKILNEWQVGCKNKKNAVDRSALYAEKLDVLRTFKYAQMMINGGASPIDYISIEEEIRSAKGYNGTYYVCLEKGEQIYTTIMDRKRIFFDKCLISGYGRVEMPQGSNYCIISDNSKNRFYIFDFIHHDFLTLEGSCKFAMVNYGAFNNNHIKDKYMCIAMARNQKALINKEVMKPIRSRTGSCWFEDIRNIDGSQYNYHDNRINIPYRFGDNALLEMVYDSSAGEVYVFNLGTGRFVDLKNGEEGYSLMKYQRHGKHGFLKYYNGTFYRYQDVGTNEWFKVGGYDTFKDIEIDDCMLVGYRGYDEEVSHYFDMKTGQYLMLNGKVIETLTPQFMNSDDWVAISLSRDHSGRYWDKCLLFNPISRTLYHDDISGWYFNVYGRGDVYEPNGKDRYTIPTPFMAARESEEQKDGVKKQFNDMVNRMS